MTEKKRAAFAANQPRMGFPNHQIVDRAAWDLVLVALKTNVARGHFREAYEGFNNCPATTSEPNDPDCICGVLEAHRALEALHETIDGFELPHEVPWW